MIGCRLAIKQDVSAEPLEQVVEAIGLFSVAKISLGHPDPRLGRDQPQVPGRANP